MQDSGFVLKDIPTLGATSTSTHKVEENVEDAGERHRSMTVLDPPRHRAVITNPEEEADEKGEVCHLFSTSWMTMCGINGAGMAGLPLNLWQRDGDVDGKCRICSNDRCPKCKEVAEGLWDGSA